MTLDIKTWSRHCCPQNCQIWRFCHLGEDSNILDNCNVFVIKVPKAIWNIYILVVLKLILVLPHAKGRCWKFFQKMNSSSGIEKESENQLLWSVSLEFSNSISDLPLRISFYELLAFDYFFFHFNSITCPSAMLLYFQLERRHEGNGIIRLKEKLYHTIVRVILSLLSKVNVFPFF